MTVDVERLIGSYENIWHILYARDHILVRGFSTPNEWATGIRALAAERDEALREQVLRLNDATQHHNARVNEKEARQKAEAEVERLREAVNLMLDGLDANADDTCGLTQEGWNEVVRKARKLARAEGTTLQGNDDVARQAEVERLRGLVTEVTELARENLTGRHRDDCNCTWCDWLARAEGEAP